MSVGSGPYRRNFPETAMPVLSTLGGIVRLAVWRNWLSCFVAVSVAWFIYNIFTVGVVKLISLQLLRGNCQSIFRPDFNAEMLWQ